MTKGTRSGWVVKTTPRPLFTPGKDPVPIVQEVGWAPGTVWTGAENLVPTGIRSPDRPARSQSLYRLSYPALLRYAKDNMKLNSLNMYFTILQKVLERRLGETDSATQRGRVVTVHLTKAFTQRRRITPLILNLGSKRI